MVIMKTIFFLGGHHLVVATMFQPQTDLADQIGAPGSHFKIDPCSAAFLGLCGMILRRYPKMAGLWWQNVTEIWRMTGGSPMTWETSIYIYIDIIVHSMIFHCINDLPFSSVLFHDFPFVEDYQLLTPFWPINFGCFPWDIGRVRCWNVPWHVPSVRDRPIYSQGFRCAWYNLNYLMDDHIHPY